MLVVGAGLVGTSVGLALCARGHAVWLTDSNAAHLHQAQQLGAGARYQGEAVDIAVAAVPPGSVAQVIVDRLRDCDGATVTDTASIKADVLRDVESRFAPALRSSRMSRYVGGHPLAGRERGGPHRARAALFVGCGWVLTPGPDASPKAVADAHWLAAECGATPLVMTPSEHDHSLAITSHLPQMVASALAAELSELPDQQLGVVGQGLRDMTRIAAADPDLWADIAAGNAAELASAMDTLSGSLSTVAAALRTDNDARAAVRRLVETGRIGHGRLPGKHGGSPRSFVIVPVLVPDQPGQFARLFADTAAAGVNVEDVRVEHAPGMPLGLIEVFVGPESAPRLRAALAERGWTLIDEDPVP